MRTVLSCLFFVGISLLQVVGLRAAMGPTMSSPPAPVPSPTAVHVMAPQPASAPAVKTIFTPFTGKITKNRVRMRLQPNLDSTVFKEMDTHDLVLVDGESDTFYAVKPPSDLKVYVFRTFVLDGVVEGNRVNVRLEPHLDAPVVAQLNTGDRVKGAISAQDKKWMEIDVPEATRFYVAKEFIEKAGDVNYIKNAPPAKAEPIAAAPKNEPAPAKIAPASKPIKQETVAIAEKTPKLEKPQVATVTVSSPAAPAPLPKASTVQFTDAIVGKNGSWSVIEKEIYENWATQNNTQASIEDFYKLQTQNAVTLHGIIEPYNRTVRNKPGDFVLVNQSNHLPIAYLYSTLVDLHGKIGQEAAVQVAPRDNHNFAFPAYFVLTVN